MLGSFLQGAKTTIRRAGALDRSSENNSTDGGGGSTSSSYINNNNISRSVSDVDFKPALVRQEDLPKPGAVAAAVAPPPPPAMNEPSPPSAAATYDSGSTYSVSRSFSLFRASSAASVSRVRKPPQVALLSSFPATPCCMT